MAFQRVGILSIGEMGFHWARVLKAHGVRVLTCAGERSETTRKRVMNAGVESVPSLDALVGEVELLVSIVVPFAAKKVAANVARAATQTRRADLLYLDANAISPMTAEEIAGILSAAGVEFVDGCIIGSAAKIDKGAVVYVSGPQAARLEALGAAGLTIKLLGAEVAQASAFKVVYAGLTKGLQALFVELLMGARKLGLLDEIMKRYDDSFPGLLDKIAPSIVGLRTHAARRAEEMIELRQTFEHHGLQVSMAPAAQRVLQAIADVDERAASEIGGREGNLAETLERFFTRGLLQESAGRAASAGDGGRQSATANKRST
jgi:3-hydroxyisobutyrate dehydrogenase-like beta-hydroxyacid dehydrogenase